MNKILLVLLFLISISFSACASKAVPVEKAPLSEPTSQQPRTLMKENWEKEWEKVLAEAKKEGKVVIMTTGGSEVRTALARGFKDKYGISTEWIVGRGAEMVQRLSSERRAGIYLADVYFAGSTTQINKLKPWGFLDPIQPLLILPEVTDTSLWYGGKFNFVDKERKYLFPAVLYVSASLFINYEVFNPEEIKSYKDLLKASLKGKIIMDDPTIPGSALRWVRVIGEKIMGQDFLRDLAKQEVTILRNERLVVDWVSRGKYSIGIGVKSDPITEYRKAGAPLKLHTPSEGTWLTGGPGILSAVNNPPQPNARKVYINWFLSREGQTIYSKVNNLQSARIDIATEFLDPLVVRKPEIPYFVTEDEEFLLKDEEGIEMARQIFGPSIKR